MAQSIIPYLLGRHLTTVTFTPLTIASDGTISTGTSQSPTARVRSFEVSASTPTDDVRGVNSPYANAVPEGYDATMTFEILLTKTANAAFLSLFANNYFLVSVVAGIDTITFYGVVTDVTAGVQSRGGNSYRISLKQMQTYTDGTADVPLAISEA